jgi:acyl-CoA reductase-like NAD-dependent aldehyde dehydrogenase
MLTNYSKFHVLFKQVEWVNQYNTYPAHAPFGGVKESGFGRENHKMALDHYRVVKT